VDLKSRFDCSWVADARGICCVATSGGRSTMIKHTVRHHRPSRNRDAIMTTLYKMQTSSAGAHGQNTFPSIPDGGLMVYTVGIRCIFIPRLSVSIRLTRPSRSYMTKTTPSRPSKHLPKPGFLRYTYLHCQQRTSS
jgi:hypothetical protein